MLELVLTINECVIALIWKRTQHMRIKSIPRMNAYYIIINIPFFFFFFFVHLRCTWQRKQDYEYRREYILINFRFLFLLHLVCTIFELLGCDPVSQYSIQYFNRSQTMTTHNKFNQYTREIFRTIIYDIIFFQTVIRYFPVNHLLALRIHISLACIVIDKYLNES